MHTLSRYGVGGGLALVVTTGLGVWMTALIAVDFIPQDKLAAANYDINPVAEDIAPPQMRERTLDYERVETPPPPTKLDFALTGKPAESPKKLEGQLPDYDPPVITMTLSPISISDRDSQPILRPAPVMPMKAQRSGHCSVEFDVSSQGAPFNIQTPYCSQSLFKNPSIKAVQKWKFTPKIQEGRPVAMTGVRNKIKFNLTDERGRLIPE